MHLSVLNGACDLLEPGKTRLLSICKEHSADEILTPPVWSLLCRSDPEICSISRVSTYQFVEVAQTHIV